MKVALLGAGNIGLATAAWLAHHGHEPVLWSPSGRSTADLKQEGARLTYSGIIAGDCRPAVAEAAAEAVAGTEIAMIAAPGNAHRAIMEAIAPHLDEGRTVIVSSLCSLSALYLSELLSRRGLGIPIATWGTTVLTARLKGPTDVAIMTVRKSLDVATLPTSAAGQGLEVSRALFGDRFVEQTNVLATSLININPIAHIGLALCNETRIERGENWPQYHYMTEGVSRLIEGLDRERLALSRAFDLKIHAIEEHFQRSFDVPLASLAETAALLHARRGGPPGPASMDTRFVSEDVPYGLVFAIAAGRVAGVAMPLHDAAITLASAVWGRDLRAENNLLPVLGLDRLSRAELLQLATEGWPPPGLAHPWT